MSDVPNETETRLIHGIPRELVPVAGLPTWLRPGEDGMLCSFDLQTTAGQWAAYQARQGESYELVDTTGKVIEVENVLIHPVTTKDEEKEELQTFLRIVLIAPNGDQFSCGSKGVLSSLMAYVACFGRRPPWKPAVQFMLRQCGKVPNRYFLLDAVRQQV